MAPRAKRIAVLFNPDNPTTAPKLQATEAAARNSNVQLSLHRVHAPSEFETSFAAIGAARADALIVLLDTIVLDSRDQIVVLAAKHRLPAIYEIREFVEAGGLLSYGTNFAERFMRAGTYVEKILKGAKPSELPVEQPVKFELTVNLKTARALGLEVPPLLLARADEVIE
jgi:putative ABC transport system substrate-binding protein